MGIFNRRWFKIGTGAAVGVTTILGLFYFLVIQYGFIIIDQTGNIECAGNLTNPCISEFQVRNPTKYNIDIYSPDNIRLDFSPQISDYALFVKDNRCSATGTCRCELKDGSLIGYENWRCIDFTNKTKPRKDTSYVYRFSSYSTTNFKLVGFKNNPNDNVKWGFGVNESYLDPFWWSVSGTPTTEASEITMELGSQINITANLTGYSGEVCIDIDHPSYGLNYSCGTPNANFLFNISYFRNNQLNDSSTIKNLTYTKSGGNRTVYLTAHQYDDISNFLINLTGHSYDLDGFEQTYDGWNASTDYSGATISFNTDYFVDGEYSLDLMSGSWTPNVVFAHITKIMPVTANLTIHYDKVSGAFPQHRMNITINGVQEMEFLEDGPGWKNVSFLVETGDEVSIYITQASSYATPTSTLFDMFVYNESATYPKDVKIYINNTLSNEIGDLFPGTSENITEFNDSSTEKQIIFDKAETNIVYLSIPKVANITLAQLNLTGSNITWMSLEDDTEDNVSNSFDTPAYGTPYWDPNVGNAYDENFGTVVATLLSPPYALNFNGYIYENYSVPSDVVAANITWRAYTSTGDGAIMYCYDGSWQVLKSLTSPFHNYYTFPVLDSCFASSPLQLKILLEYDATGGSVLSSGTFEDKVWWYSNNPPTNLRLEVGVPDGDYEFQYLGSFEQSNNRTNDFSDAINTYLGVCTENSYGFCTIPLYFTSQTGGILNLSDLKISYIFDPNPITLDNDLISSFLGNSTNFVDIPLTFETSEGGIIEISDIRLDYAGGNDTIQVEVYNIDEYKCYQEFADLTTCGNTAGNSITESGYVGEENMIDGSWSTYTQVGNLGNIIKVNSVYYINSLNTNYTWQYKIDKGGGLEPEFANLTVPFSCVHDDLLNLSITATVVDGSSKGYANFTCDDTLLYQANSSDVGFDFYIYEEAMIWAINVSEYLNLTNYYSKWNYNLPYRVNYLEFIPNTPTSKNVTPYGQTSLTPIFNITTMNYGGKNMNLSIYLNESMSCVNLTYSTDQYKSNGTLLTNQSWQYFNTNLEYNNVSSLFLWADYSCNYTNWYLFYPELYISGCCEDCVCDRRFD